MARSQVASDTFDSSISSEWSAASQDGGLPTWVTGGHADVSGGLTRRNVGTYSDDQYSKIVIQNHGISAGNISVIGCGVRMQSTGDFYSCSVVSVNNYGAPHCYEIIHWEGTGGVILATAGTAHDLNAGDIVVLEVEGDTLTMFTDEGSGEVERVSITDSNVTSGRPGVSGYAESGDPALITSWEGGDLTSGPLPGPVGPQSICVMF